MQQELKKYDESKERAQAIKKLKKEKQITYFTKCKTVPALDKAYNDKVEESYTQMQNDLVGKPPLSRKVKATIGGVVGAVIGFAVGATIGVITTGGFGSIPLGLLAAVKGLTVANQRQAHS